MITPIRVLNIREVCGRMNDLLVSADDIKELAKNEREKAIEEFAEKIKERAHSTERNDWSADYMISIWESVIDEIAMEMKGE